MNGRLLVVCTGMVILSAQVLHAQTPTRYREFQLGSDLASVAKLTGGSPSDAKAIHERPAVIKSLEWRPRYFSGGVAPQTDPVDLIVFSFYDNQLFRVVVDYDAHRTEGMSEADLIEGISATYGPASKIVPKANQVSPKYGAADSTLAVWETGESSVTLLRVAYPVTFKLIVALTRLETLARAASLDALRLDVVEAPRREIARQKREADEARAAQEKAKIENKAVFRP